MRSKITAPSVINAITALIMVRSRQFIRAPRINTKWQSETALEARHLKTGDLLWDFKVEKSRQNDGWVLTGDRKFNVPFLFHSNWREAPLLATDQQIRIGGIFSSPLVVNGVVYFGSADGFLYALE